MVFTFLLEGGVEKKHSRKYELLVMFLVMLFKSSAGMPNQGLHLERKSLYVRNQVRVRDKYIKKSYFQSLSNVIIKLIKYVICHCVTIGNTYTYWY